MILTVTLNAAIDKRYVVENFRLGEVNRVKECAYTPGGKGLNVSKPAAIAGEEVVATGFVGGHAGNYIEEALKPFGIQSEFYHLEAESRSCINIWDETNRVQTEFLEPGFTVTEEQFRGFLKKFRYTGKTGRCGGNVRKCAKRAGRNGLPASGGNLQSRKQEGHLGYKRKTAYHGNCGKANDDQTESG